MAGFQSCLMPRPVLSNGRPPMPIVPRERVGLATAPAPSIPQLPPPTRADLIAALAHSRMPTHKLTPAQFEKLAIRVAEILATHRGDMRRLDLPGIKVDEIIEIVSRVTRIRRQDLLSPRRDKGTVRARQIAMWICRRYTIRSTPEIARRLGDRDHTTIIHGTKRIAAIIRDIGPASEDTPQSWATHIWANTFDLPKHSSVWQEPLLDFRLVKSKFLSNPPSPKAAQGEG